MKKFLIFLSVLVALFYLAIALAVGPLTRRAIERAIREDHKHGLDILEIKFKRAYPSSFKSITWTGGFARLHFLSGDEFMKKREFVISVDKMTLKLKNLGHRKFGIRATGLNIKTLSGEGEDLESFDYVEGQNLEIKFVLDFFHPKTIAEQARVWSKGLGDLLIKGRTAWPVEFSGAIFAQLHNKTYKVRLSVRPEGNEYALMMYESDLKNMASKLQERITDAEIKLISKYPLRAPSLLKISDYAFNAAVAAHKKQEDVSENTYRHVVWSYRLTRQYGEVFAKMVTDAHENQTEEADSDIDQRNNAVGRNYAKEGIPESAILGRLLTDPGAVLDASEWPKMKHRKLAEPRLRTPPS